MNGGQMPSAFNDPRSEIVGRWMGLLSQQPLDLRDGIGALRMRIRLGQIGYAPIPSQINLMMGDGTQINGREVEVSYNSNSGDVRLIIGQWDGPSFTWAAVDIAHDTIVVVVRRNPPEAGKEVRPPNPLVIHATPSSPTEGP